MWEKEEFVRIRKNLQDFPRICKMLCLLVPGNYSQNRITKHLKKMYKLKPFDILLT